MKAGWNIKPFDECIAKVTYTTKIPRQKFLSNGAFPIISQEAELINGYWDNEDDLFTVKSPVVIFGDHTKIFKFIDFDFILGADGVKILQPNDFLNPKFFYYQLQATPLDSLGYARHYKLLKGLQVKYPPLPEQQRIVAILDEAFEAIAAAHTNAEQNRQNARALFESYLQSVFSQRGEGWVDKPIGELCQRLHQGLNTAGEKIKFVETGYPIIQTRNIDEGVVDLNHQMKFMSEDDWHLYRDKYRPETGDVFFTNIGTIGKTAIVKEERDYLIHWNIFKLRPRFDLISPAYLRYSLEQLTLSGYFKRMQKGGTVDFVTKKMISEATLSLPSMTIQADIVCQMDSLREKTQRLESLYQRKIAALDELKQSLLQQAFSGQL
ncbi:restriction endonuclease subunit S [Aeromonas veronii]